MKRGSILSPAPLKAFLNADPVSTVLQERGRETYDLLSFGGGSCPKVVGRYAARFGWKAMCFLTNGSDNGGSTQKIVEALRPEYGPTLPVGDITSALIGLQDPFQYELLNLRSWHLDPERFTANERQAFDAALKDISCFYDRLALSVKWYLDKFADHEESKSSKERFAAELLECGRLVDEVGLIRSGVKGLELSEASIRHHCFNALMIRIGAYDSNRKTPDPDWFMVGLSLLQHALSIQHAVFPCSLDEQVLYAEWVDRAGTVIWSTKHTLPDNPVTAMSGQVALSNAPDSVKLLKNGEYARYGRFGFDPERPAPRSYPEAVGAIRRVRPGAPILFGPSSYVASIAPCLAIREVVDQIANRSDCPRILFLNLTLNNETVGWHVTDFLDFWELNTGRPVADTLDYIVVNNDLESSREVAEALQDKGDTLETFKFRGPVKLTDAERGAIPERGLHLVEVPLAAVTRELMRLSSTGERKFVWVPSHHAERLMALCHVLVQDFNDERAGNSLKVSGQPGRKKKFGLDPSGQTEAIVYYPSAK
ncbi:MAG: YvcK family protein [Verrucomicrobia bacterium]|nr:YvcK family protein [Verrucomicrobiota bacterium]